MNMKKVTSIILSMLMLVVFVAGFSVSAFAKSNKYVGTIPGFVKTGFTAAGADTKLYQKDHKYCIAVNTSQNIVIVYKADKTGKFTKPVKAMVCSCGEIPGSTLPGTWATYGKHRWRDLVGDVHGQYATRIVGSVLFHSVPYFEEDPSTLETDEYNKLGSNASAGCVRLAVKDAKWIYDKCALGTIVTIYPGKNVKEPLKKPKPIRIPSKSPYAGWDPTDPDIGNPWNQ